MHIHIIVVFNQISELAKILILQISLIALNTFNTQQSIGLSYNSSNYIKLQSSSLAIHHRYYMLKCTIKFTNSLLVSPLIELPMAHFIDLGHQHSCRTKLIQHNNYLFACFLQLTFNCRQKHDTF